MFEISVSNSFTGQLIKFYRTVEKVKTCDGNGQKFWQVPLSFQPSHFGYYFFLFCHDWDKGTIT